MNLRTALLLGSASLAMLPPPFAAEVRPSDDRPTFAIAADSVITAFERAWEQRDALVYDDLLAPDFVFGFRPQPSNEKAPPTEVFERERELQVVARLFGRESGRRDDGRTISAVQAVHLWLRPRDEWSRSREPEHAGTVRRLYLAEMVLETESGDRVQVRGIQEFYVRIGRDARSASLQGWNEPAAWQVGPTYVDGPAFGDVKRWYVSSDR